MNCCTASATVKYPHARGLRGAGIHPRGAGERRSATTDATATAEQTTEGLRLDDGEPELLRRDPRHDPLNKRRKRRTPDGEISSRVCSAIEPLGIASLVRTGGVPSAAALRLAPRCRSLASISARSRKRTCRQTHRSRSASSTRSSTAARQRPPSMKTARYRPASGWTARRTVHRHRRPLARRALLEQTDAHPVFVAMGLADHAGRTPRAARRPRRRTHPYDWTPPTDRSLGHRRPNRLHARSCPSTPAGRAAAPAAARAPNRTLRGTPLRR